MERNQEEQNETVYGKRLENGVNLDTHKKNLRGTGANRTNADKVDCIETNGVKAGREREGKVKEAVHMRGLKSRLTCSQKSKSHSNDFLQ